MKSGFAWRKQGSLAWERRLREAIPVGLEENVVPFKQMVFPDRIDRIMQNYFSDPNFVNPVNSVSTTRRNLHHT